MATITVRDLPDDVQRRLKARAVANDRSMEAEARAILSAAVAVRGFGPTWLELAANYRGDELPVPLRSPSRDIDLS